MSDKKLSVAVIGAGMAGRAHAYGIGRRVRSSTPHSPMSASPRLPT